MQNSTRHHDFDQVDSRSVNTIWRRRALPLEVFFKPRTVAIVGASDSPGSVGQTLVKNILNNSFRGKTYLINPNKPEVAGKKTFQTVRDVPEKIDLVVIATPAKTVPDIVSECVAVGVKGAIIISAGFKESGAEGTLLEHEILNRIRSGPTRIIGPNCLGVMCPASGLNATFASKPTAPGRVAFISQSGALCTAILDWSLKEHIGFSAFVSIGSMLDVGWGDLIDYLSDDPRTESILIYMETIGDARSFLSAAREAALRKPIIVIKAGRTEAAAKAAVSHTGSLAGSDEVLNAVFRRAGVLRVEEISDLFQMAEILAKQPRPKGPNLTIITNAGGPGVLATDALVASGGMLTPLSAETLGSLDAILPKHWSHDNPIDVLGDADPERYAKTIEITMKEEKSNGILVVLTPQAMTDPTKTAEVLSHFSKTDNKPILASWMGGVEVEAGREILRQAQIPVIDYPDSAARVFDYMWHYNCSLQSLYETPVLPASPSGILDFGGIGTLEEIEIARKSGRTLLTEPESKRILSAYGIPVVETAEAFDEDGAVDVSKKMGYPVVLKLLSRKITHKAAAGGVKLNLFDENSVREAYRQMKEQVTKRFGEDSFSGVSVQPFIAQKGYEVILGSSVDAQFGPVILFGMGGSLVEVFRDHALALPPLNTTLARRLMEQTRIYDALTGLGAIQGIDLKKLEEILVRFSWLVAEQRGIREIDINPLFISAEKQIAMDARIVLFNDKITEEYLPKLAIRPYPSQYVGEFQLRNDARVLIRPICPEDEPLMIDFHKTLSEQTVRQRYFHMIQLDQRISHERLIRVCFGDFDRELALVAEHTNEKTKLKEIIGVGRLSRVHGTNEAEFAVLVSDYFQNKGLGKRLLMCLLDVAKCEGIRLVWGEMFADNALMKRIVEDLGFQLRFQAEDNLLQASIGI